MTGFVQLVKNEDEIELFKERPTAFVLLALISIRAKRSADHPNKELQIGEAYVGDWNSYTRGRQIYRTDLTFLEKHGKVTTRTTNRGTIVKVITTAPFNINTPDIEEKTEVSQPTANHQLTTNNNINIKEEKNSKNSHTPCTEEELKEISQKLRISLQDVKDKHEEIMTLVEEKTIKKYHSKTTYHTLYRWLKMDIKKKAVYQYTESEWEDEMLLSAPIPPKIQEWFKTLES